ncbi:asparagine synthase (glutamine-hydrolysing) [uncultured bacterium]|nr:asparagine synthase (glutamine-hydrolysing) [uncultured bacterium]
MSWHNATQHSFSKHTPDELLLVRGAYSATPLYFFERPIKTAKGNTWLVSHSLKEIGNYVNYRPSPEGIRDFLCYGFVPAPRTIFQGIKAVPPAMMCRLSKKSDDIVWQAIPQHNNTNLSNPEQQFWQQLCQLAQTEHAALLLSGGLDSAMIAASACVTGAKINAYHARFRGSEINKDSDTHAARLTAQHLKLPYQEISIGSLEALYWFEKVISALDQPLGDPVILPFYLLFREIAKSKQKTVLTGEGGDQLFGSWSMKPMLMRELYAEANYRREQGYLASFHKFDEEWESLISAQLGQQLNRNIDLESPIREAFLSSPSKDFCNQLRWVDLQLKGMQHILPRINTMANSWQLELQQPFFQPELIDLSIALPNQLKMSASSNKVLLKQLAKQYLPESVIERRKQGMGVPTTQWFKRGLMPLALYWLNTNRLIQSELLNPNTVKAIRQQKLSTRDARGRRWGDRLWMLCVLECWFSNLPR